MASALPEFTVRPSALAGLTLVAAHTSWRFARHTHAVHGIGLIDAGDQTCIDNQRLRGQSPDILQTIAREMNLSVETVKDHVAAVLRALDALGYIDAKGYKDFLAHGAYSLALAAQFEPVQQDALRLINSSLATTHL